ncbi:hypothetical protein [Sorangium sp. So ce1078]|uniref:hypothetical protein n=1 Tax=Sorangium sp. So ce1078 TaxID=3133329 RepID=UPI003F607448
MRIIASALLILTPAITLAGCGEGRETEQPVDSSGASGAGSGGAGGYGGEGGGPGEGGGSPPAEAWYRQISGPDNENAGALAIDGEANVVVAGNSMGTTDFGAGATPLLGVGSKGRFEDLFVATYAADDGALRWARRFGGGRVTATGVAVDGNDGIAVVGHYSHGPLEAGDLVLEEPERDDPRFASSDLFVLALDRDGVPRWMHRLGGGGIDLGGRVAVGPENDVVVAAQSGSSLTLARFAADGTTRFATDVGKLVSVTPFAPISGVVVDLHGDILVAGHFSDDADLGGGTTTGLTGVQAWVAKYSGEDGVLLWSRHIGAPGDFGIDNGDMAEALIVDEHGDVLIAGQFARGADLGEGPIDTTSGAFLMKLAGEDGAIRWSKALPAPDADVGSIGLSLAPDGRVALIASLGAPFDLGGGSVDERGTYLAAYEPGTGAFVAQRRIVELGEPSRWFTGSALDAKGHLSIMTMFEEAQTSIGALKSEGWGDILLAHLPL